MRACFLVMLAVLAGRSPLLAQAPPEPPAPVEIMIRATGDGFPGPGQAGGAAVLMAKRAAEITAVRNLAAVIGGMVRGAEPGEWTSEVVQGHRVVSTEELPGGGFRVTVELPVAALATALHAQLARREALEREVAGAKKDADESRARERELTDKLAHLAKEYDDDRGRAQEMMRRQAELHAAREAEVAQLQAKVNELEAYVAALKAELDALRRRAEEVAAAVAGSIEALRAALETARGGNK